MNTPKELDLITDVVLAYKPKPKTKAAKKRCLRGKQATCCKRKANGSHVYNSQMIGDIWYRCDGTSYAALVDEFDNPAGCGRPGVNTHPMKVIRETPKGVWLEAFGAPRFVRTDARKKYASPTEEEAILSFIARKRRQSRILTAQLETVKELTDLALRAQQER